MREPEAGITSESRHGWWQWGVTILFLLWQVAFQFAYGFFAEPIQAEFSLTAAEAAAVSSVYLLAYGLMQVPAGLLLDRFTAVAYPPSMVDLEQLEQSNFYFFKAR